MLRENRAIENFMKKISYKYKNIIRIFQYSHI